MDAALVAVERYFDSWFREVPGSTLCKVAKGCVRNAVSGAYLHPFAGIDNETEAWIRGVCARHGLELPS